MTRCWGPLIFFLLLLVVPGVAESSRVARKYLLFVGTYTDKGSKGIYSYQYDAASGDLTPLGLAAETANPSFLTIAPGGGFLYAVNELSKYKDADTGAVSAFAIDRKTGKLSLLNQVVSHGADPCYIAFDKTGKFVLVANYTGGTVAVLPVLPDGHLSEATAALRDRGTHGPNKERQDAPHAHWIEASAGNRYVYVSDLGLDRVLIYKFDAANGRLTTGANEARATKPGSTGASDFFAATLAPGTGPRHVAFSTDGSFMYVLGELDNTVTVFANDARETFRSVQRISTLPAGFRGENTTAEIAIHPNGKFLYASNRGHDSIAVFSIDAKTGTLTLVDRVSTGGKTPRHFEIDPTGTRLFAANQDSGNIVVFQIDNKTGKLTPTGKVLEVPSPVCLKFVAVE